MGTQVRAELVADGLAPDEIETSFEIDVRYTGQAFEVPMTIDASLGNWADFAPGQITVFGREMALPAGRLHFAGEHTAVSNRGLEGALDPSERAVLEKLRRAGPETCDDRAAPRLSQICPYLLPCRQSPATTVPCCGAQPKGGKR